MADHKERFLRSALEHRSPTYELISAGHSVCVERQRKARRKRGEERRMAQAREREGLDLLPRNPSQG